MYSFILFVYLFVIDLFVCLFIFNCTNFRCDILDNPAKTNPFTRESSGKLMGKARRGSSCGSESESEEIRKKLGLVQESLSLSSVFLSTC